MANEIILEIKRIHQIILTGVRSTCAATQHALRLTGRKNSDFTKFSGDVGRTLEEFVNHSPAARDLQILLVFYQHPAWFISL